GRAVGPPPPAPPNPSPAVLPRRARPAARDGRDDPPLRIPAQPAGRAVPLLEPRLRPARPRHRPHLGPGLCRLPAPRGLPPAGDDPRVGRRRARARATPGDPLWDRREAPADLRDRASRRRGCLVQRPRPAAVRLVPPEGPVE